MKKKFKPTSAALNRYRFGPLAAHLDGFAGWLGEQGYSANVGVQKLRLVAMLSRWLEQGNFGVRQVDERLIAAFCRACRKALRKRRQVRHTLAQMLAHLRRSEVIAEPQHPQPADPVSRLLSDYGRFLIQERGLSQSTLRNYLPVVRRFLADSFGSQPPRLENLAAADISRFILRDLPASSPGRVQLAATGLRSFLGYLHLRGNLTAPLAQAVPAVAARRSPELPRFLEPEQVLQLLHSCDRTSAGGRRDYAVLMLLARLGLRSGEVVHLCLEDINWVDGEVMVRGKSSRIDRLPLPAAVGRALASYLLRDRPPCASRRVFIRMKAPHVGFSSSVAVGDIVRRAFRQTGLRPATGKGVQLLRHSLATRMLRGGASMTQISQILRHQLPQTTEIYAKVDLEALRALAQPWPGGVR